MGQRSRTFFPIPTEWQEGLSGIQLLGTVFFAGSGIFVIFHGMSKAASGDLLSASFAISLGLALILLPAVGIFNNRGRTRISIDNIDTGDSSGSTVIREAAAHVSLMAGLLFSIMVAGATFSVGTWAGWLEYIPMSGGQRAIFPPVALALAVYAMVHLVVYLANGNARRIVLSPSGISVPRGSFYSSDIEWKDLRKIGAEISRGNAAGLLKLESRPDRVMRIPVSSMAIGGPATYWMLRFYHDSPQFRGELADGRAATRMSAYDLFPADGSST